MNVLITGTSTGIGKFTAEKFLNEGHAVYGLDKEVSSIEHVNYKHYICDITKINTYPILPEINYIINNAGTDNQEDAISTNLTSLFKIEDKYLTDKTLCVINIASTSAHLGIESREYVASKGGVLSYTKQLAKKMSEWKGRSNSISPGPIETQMNEKILNSDEKYLAVANQNLLKKWINPSEVADAIYFLSMAPSITGIDLVIDAGETINHTEIK